MKIVQMVVTNHGLTILTDSGEIWERVGNLPVIGRKGEGALEHNIYGELFYEWKKIDGPPCSDEVAEQFGILSREMAIIYSPRG